MNVTVQAALEVVDVVDGELAGEHARITARAVAAARADQASALAAVLRVRALIADRRTRQHVSAIPVAELEAVLDGGHSPRCLRCGVGLAVGDTINPSPATERHPAGFVHSELTTCRRYGWTWRALGLAPGER